LDDYELEQPRRTARRAPAPRNQPPPPPPPPAPPAPIQRNQRPQKPDEPLPRSMIM
jgi:hypothetical protein